jgi:acyl-coenzyme A synthetase/AMP-(fatty) acid ligase
MSITPTSSVTGGLTPTATGSQTSTGTGTGTSQITDTPTNTATNTGTGTVTQTPSYTSSVTITSTQTQTGTASRSKTGGYTIFGRSDATLNSKGVRIGTAEIYRVVEKFSEVKESMAIAQDWEDDSRVVLFLVMNNGAELNHDLSLAIRKALREEASPRHVPDKIITTPELPRTKSNKLVELAVADLINGRIVRNRDALLNPQALDWFADCVELKQP